FRYSPAADDTTATRRRGGATSAWHRTPAWEFEFRSGLGVDRLEGRVAVRGVEDLAAVTGDHAILGAGLEQLVVAGLAVRQHALTVLVGRAGRPALRVGDGVLRLGRQRRQRDRLEARGVTAFGHGCRVGRSAAVAGLDQGEARVVVGG